MNTKNIWLKKDSGLKKLSKTNFFWVKLNFWSGNLFEKNCGSKKNVRSEKTFKKKSYILCKKSLEEVFGLTSLQLLSWVGSEWVAGWVAKWESGWLGG